MIHNRVAGYDLPASRLAASPESPGGADWQALARDQGLQALSQFERIISEHPRVCIGIGLAMGVVLGWLVKRR
jgi:hypothetical protein